MEKSGQRPPYPEIIDEPGLKTKKRVFGEIVITLGFWGLILYLLEFIITIFLWLFGFNLMHLEIYELGNQEMVRLFKNAGWLTTIVIVATLGWSYYNMLIFKIRGERRGNRVRVCFDQEVADFFKVDPEMLEKVKNFPSVSIVMKEDAILISESAISACPANLPQ